MLQMESIILGGDLPETDRAVGGISSKDASKV